jgi:hypothetical protein
MTSKSVSALAFASCAAALSLRTNGEVNVRVSSAGRKVLQTELDSGGIDGKRVSGFAEFELPETNAIVFVQYLRDIVGDRAIRLGFRLCEAVLDHVLSYLMPKLSPNFVKFLDEVHFIVKAERRFECFVEKPVKDFIEKPVKDFITNRLYSRAMRCSNWIGCTMLDYINKNPRRHYRDAGWALQRVLPDAFKEWGPAALYHMQLLVYRGNNRARDFIVDSRSWLLQHQLFFSYHKPILKFLLRMSMWTTVVTRNLRRLFDKRLPPAFVGHDWAMQEIFRKRQHRDDEWVFFWRVIWTHCVETDIPLSVDEIKFLMNHGSYVSAEPALVNVFHAGFPSQIDEDGVRIGETSLDADELNDFLSGIIEQHNWETFYNDQVPVVPASIIKDSFLYISTGELGSLLPTFATSQIHKWLDWWLAVINHRGTAENSFEQILANGNHGWFIGRERSETFATPGRPLFMQPESQFRNMMNLFIAAGADLNAMDVEGSYRFIDVLPFYDEQPRLTETQRVPGFLLGAGNTQQVPGFVLKYFREHNVKGITDAIVTAEFHKFLEWFIHSPSQGDLDEHDDQVNHVLTPMWYKWVPGCSHPENSYERFEYVMDTFLQAGANLNAPFRKPYLGILRPNDEDTMVSILQFVNNEDSIFHDPTFELTPRMAYVKKYFCTETIGTRQMRLKVQKAREQYIARRPTAHIQVSKFTRAMRRRKIHAKFSGKPRDAREKSCI